MYCIQRILEYFIIRERFLLKMPLFHFIDVPDLPEDKWPIQICNTFADMTLGCLCFAELQLPQNNSTERIGVRLYDTSGDFDVIVNKVINSHEIS